MIFSFNLKRFLISVLIPLAVGGLSAFITRNSMDIYDTINNPPLAPTSWVFPVVWTVLYALMGISFYLVWNSRESNSQKLSAYIFFIIQLALNFIWSPIFFGMQNFLLAFFVLILMWIATFGMIITFYRISKVAGILQIPYILWLSFAGYLNYSIYLLN